VITADAKMVRYVRENSVRRAAVFLEMDGGRLNTYSNYKAPCFDQLIARIFWRRSVSWKLNAPWHISNNIFGLFRERSPTIEILHSWISCYFYIELKLFLCLITIPLRLVDEWSAAPLALFITRGNVSCMHWLGDREGSSRKEARWVTMDINTDSSLMCSTGRG
jgi:hypothetical protein